MSDVTTNAAVPADTTEEKTAAVPVTKTVAGERHVSPPARHSQQSHARATARAEALGFTTARELHDYDRAAVLAKLQKGTDGALAQQRNEQNRRSGGEAEKA